MLPCLDALLVPVTVAGETYMFLLDTGASLCAFDKSLGPLLGEPVGREYVQTASGVEAIDIYFPDQVFVGGIALSRDEPATCHDLSGLARVTGHDIRGLLGMTFMVDRALQLDFEEQKIRFLSSPVRADDDLGQAIRIDMEPGVWIPTMSVTVADTIQWEVKLDTGCSGFGVMERETYDQLLDLGSMAPFGVGGAVSSHRTYREERGVLDSLSFGSSVHRGPVLGRGEASVLGVPFIARYEVILDFPERVGYFRETGAVAFPDHLDYSGLVLMKLGNELVVRWASVGGPAHTAGLQQGDVILTLGGRDAADLSLACAEEEIQRALGGKLPVAVFREGKELELMLDLGRHWIEPAESDTVAAPAFPDTTSGAETWGSALQDTLSESEADSGFLTFPELLVLTINSETLYQITPVSDAYIDSVAGGCFTDLLWPPRNTLPFCAEVVVNDEGDRLLVEHELPEDVEKIFLEAEKLFARRAYSDALVLYEHAEALAPDSYVIQLVIGDCYYFTGEYEPALSRYSRALLLNPLDYKCHYFRANALHRLRRFPEATRGFRRALALSPGHPIVLGIVEAVQEDLGVALYSDPFCFKAHAEGDRDTVLVTHALPVYWFAYGLCKGVWLAEESHRVALTGGTEYHWWQLLSRRTRRRRRPGRARKIPSWSA